MAADLLALLIRLNLAMAVAALAVIILRAPARRLFGSQLVYGLWLAAPAAMLAALAPPRVATEAAPPSLPLDAVARSAAAWTDGVVLPGSAPGGPDAALWLIGLWGLGAAACLALVLVAQVRSVRALGELTPTSDRKILRSAAAWAGPAVVGAFRPRIITPADFDERFDEAEREMILAHERVHLARGDAAINALSIALQCLCWFNPLTHLAAHLMRRDQEMACDAAVVGPRPAVRQTYATAMLKSQLAPKSMPLGCHWPARRKTSLMERVLMMKLKAPSRTRRAAGMTFAAAVSVATGYAAWASHGEVAAAARQIVETATPLLPTLQPVRMAAAAAPSAETTARPASRPAVERTLTASEQESLARARADLADARARLGVGVGDSTSIASAAARLAGLEKTLEGKSATADEALRLAQAEVERTRNDYAVGMATRADVGRAIERLGDLQLALGVNPTGYIAALDYAREGVTQAQAMFDVGAARKDDIVAAQDRVKKLEALQPR